MRITITSAGADLGGGCRGCAPPLPPEMTCGFLIQPVFCKKKTMWFIGVEVQQETSAPLPKKNPGSAPDQYTSTFYKQPPNMPNGFIATTTRNFTYQKNC